MRVASGGIGVELPLRNARAFRNSRGRTLRIRVGSIVRSHTDGQRWELNERGHAYRVRIVGEAEGDPHVLPVPLPAERRNVSTDFEHLAGHLTLEVSGRLQSRGESNLAGLEIGHRPSTSERRARTAESGGAGADRLNIKALFRRTMRSEK